VLGHRADHKTPSTNGRDPRGTSQKIVMKRRELPKDPTSSRRKAIILEVGTLGHILLTSSLGYRLIEKSLVSAWPRIKKKGRGQAGKDQ